jgi:hypothetical protein
LEYSDNLLIFVDKAVAEMVVVVVSQALKAGKDYFSRQGDEWSPFENVSAALSVGPSVDRMWVV